MAEECSLDVVAILGLERASLFSFDVGLVAKRGGFRARVSISKLKQDPESSLIRAVRRFVAINGADFVNVRRRCSSGRALRANIG
jgi:hypothetical protein